MLNLLRRFRFTYSIYNFFQKKKLIHNVSQYKKLNLNKKYYSSISSYDFNHLEQKSLPLPNVNNLIETNIYKKSGEQTRESILSFNENGYIILSEYYSENEVDNINISITEMTSKGYLKERYPNRLMFAYHTINSLKEIGKNKDLIELLSTIFGNKALLFQSMNFQRGTEQRTHSDSIHMTTYPLGGLLGVWIALEDITSENGPLHYYPKSHLLPYFLNTEFNNQGSKFLLGKKSYSAYEDAIEELVSEYKLEKKIFTAKKGDVLIWHANLLHGAEKHIDKTKTRKSVVFHYYSDNTICYHEITQRPALINPMYT